MGPSSNPTITSNSSADANLILIASSYGNVSYIEDDTWGHYPTGNSWVDRSFAYNTNILNFTSSRKAYVSLLIIVSVFVLAHSQMVHNYSRRYTSIRLQTEIGAAAGLFLAICELVAVHDVTPVKWAVAYQFFSNGLLTAVVQVCDNYVFLSCLCVVHKISRRMRIFYHLFIWVGLVFTWLPANTIVPFFYNMNSVDAHSVVYYMVAACNFASVLYNCFVTFHVVWVLFSLTSIRFFRLPRWMKHNSTSPIGDLNVIGVAPGESTNGHLRAKVLFIRIVGLKNVGHCVTSSIASMYWIYMIPYADPFYAITLILGMHVWFNMKLEGYFGIQPFLSDPSPPDSEPRTSGSLMLSWSKHPILGIPIRMASLMSFCCLLLHDMFVADVFESYEEHDNNHRSGRSKSRGGSGGGGSGPGTRQQASSRPAAGTGTGGVNNNNNNINHPGTRRGGPSRGGGGGGGGVSDLAGGSVMSNIRSGGAAPQGLRDNVGGAPSLTTMKGPSLRDRLMASSVQPPQQMSLEVSRGSGGGGGGGGGYASTAAATAVRAMRRRDDLDSSGHVLVNSNIDDDLNRSRNGRRQSYGSSSQWSPSKPSGGGAGSHNNRIDMLHPSNPHSAFALRRKNSKSRGSFVVAGAVALGDHRRKSLPLQGGESPIKEIVRQHDRPDEFSSNVEDRSGTQSGGIDLHQYSSRGLSSDKQKQQQQQQQQQQLKQAKATLNQLVARAKRHEDEEKEDDDIGSLSFKDGGLLTSGPLLSTKEATTDIRPSFGTPPLPISKRDELCISPEQFIPRQLSVVTEELRLSKVLESSRNRSAPLPSTRTNRNHS